MQGGWTTKALSNFQDHLILEWFTIIIHYYWKWWTDVTLRCVHEIITSFRQQDTT